MSARGHRRSCIGPAIAIAALLALAGCGEGEQTPPRAKDPFRAVPQDTITAPADKAAPRWEPVTSFAGRGTVARTVNISKGAIQWRARWRCTSERLSLVISPPPRSGSARAEGDCPGEHAWVADGRRELRVKGGTGPWRVNVEQEVDTALHELPLPAMEASGTKVLARGDFYKIERKGLGSATLYRLADGRLALRMEGFRTDANTDLLVWLSKARRPRTTKAAFNSRHRDVAPLKSTLGDQNYLLPRGVDAAKVRSIVIWCEPVQIAYTAATLAR